MALAQGVHLGDTVVAGKGIGIDPLQIEDPLDRAEARLSSKGEFLAPALPWKALNSPTNGGQEASLHYRYIMHQLHSVTLRLVE
jgi:hypothetical protein